MATHARKSSGAAARTGTEIPSEHRFSRMRDLTGRRRRLPNVQCPKPQGNRGHSGNGPGSWRGLGRMAVVGVYRGLVRVTQSAGAGGNAGAGVAAVCRLTGRRTDEMIAGAGRAWAARPIGRVRVRIAGNGARAAISLCTMAATLPATTEGVGLLGAIPSELAVTLLGRVGRAHVLLRCGHAGRRSRDQHHALVPGAVQGSHLREHLDGVDIDGFPVDLDFGQVDDAVAVHVQGARHFLVAVHGEHGVPGLLVPGRRDADPDPGGVGRHRPVQGEQAGDVVGSLGRQHVGFDEDSGGRRRGGDGHQTVGLAHPVSSAAGEIGDVRFQVGDQGRPGKSVGGIEAIAVQRLLDRDDSLGGSPGLGFPDLVLLPGDIAGNGDSDQHQGECGRQIGLPAFPGGPRRR